MLLIMHIQNLDDLHVLYAASEPKAFRPTPVNPSVTFPVVLTLLVLVIVTGVILLADPVIESYGVFAVGGVMNTSRAN